MKSAIYLHADADRGAPGVSACPPKRAARRWKRRRSRRSRSEPTTTPPYLPESSPPREPRPAHIFKRAGISLEWIECRVPDSVEGAACTEPLLAGRDIMLRLVDRPPSHGERIVALGRVDARSRAARRSVDDDRRVSRSHRCRTSLRRQSRRCSAVPLPTRSGICCSAAPNIHGWA